MWNDLRKTAKDLNKHYFLGTCVNLFDEDGDCLIGQISDVSDFAQILENDAVEISRGEFYSKILNSPVDFSGNFEFLYIQNRDLYIAYDVDKDVHYIFGR